MLKLKSALACAAAAVIACCAGGQYETCLAQNAEGSVEFSGAGVGLLPSSTFVPHLYAGEQPTWSFFDEAGTVSIVVIETNGDPSTASLVSVAVLDGATWTALSFIGGVPGLNLEGDTITFDNVNLPELGKRRTNIVLSGSLTRTDLVRAGDQAWGAIKRAYAPSQ